MKPAMAAFTAELKRSDLLPFSAGRLKPGQIEAQLITIFSLSSEDGVR
jgi:hypothetical protein